MLFSFIKTEDYNIYLVLCKVVCLMLNITFHDCQYLWRQEISRGREIHNILIISAYINSILLWEQLYRS